METQFFTEFGPVKQEIARLQDTWNDRRVSDVVDSGGNQYADLVMEGGGVLGVALIGYVYALESVGLRFLSVGGASAGAINALLMAASGPPNHSRSDKLLGKLANVDMASFVDGDRDARRFIDAFLKKRGLFRLVMRGLQVVDNMVEDLGLNPGDEFLRWLREALADFGVGAVAELRRRMNAAPDDLRHREDPDWRLQEVELAVIAADLTTQTKVVFPQMSNLYFNNPDQVDPALFVRASMSVPGFFQPFRVRRLPRGATAKQRWQAVSFTGEIPREALFVDGGVLSNFPIDAFHQRARVPARPTFGVRLGHRRNKAAKVETPGQLAGSLFNTARHCRDYDFIFRNPDYRRLIGVIDTGDHNWLNFSLDDRAKRDLFLRGVKQGAAFIASFDWDDYKDLRQRLLSQ